MVVIYDMYGTELVFFRLRDVRAKCGPDAYSYLNLLRHLIFLMCIVTIFSISVILPVNYNVGDQRKYIFVIYTVYTYMVQLNYNVTNTNVCV